MKKLLTLGLRSCLRRDRSGRASSDLSTLIKDHLAGGASRLAALLLRQILPVFSVVAPCHPGAALRDLVLVHRGQATSLAAGAIGAAAAVFGWAIVPQAAQPDVQRPHVTFLRDVAPILNKVGCTAGACHGAAKGKNGFKLSLRGYDPRFDYEALLYDLSGRRFNRADPGRSLMLAKPSQEVAHGGGRRFAKDSDYYK